MATFRYRAEFDNFVIAAGHRIAGGILCRARPLWGTFTVIALLEQRDAALYRGIVGATGRHRASATVDRNVLIVGPVDMQKADVLRAVVKIN